MQATLLSIGIAIILALVAALIGPHFVDWPRYRAKFEAEATRLVGVPVRIGGRIDARLLPTPSLVLEDVDLGSGTTAPQLYTKRLSIEFALGPMLRGQWRASEVRLIQPAVRIGLDQKGAIDWPRSSMNLNPDQLSVDRFVVVDGHVALADAGSGSSLNLDHVSFAGEIRSLLGPAKGEGSFEDDGVRFGYSASVGRLEDGAIKLRLELDPGDRPWKAEADGLLHVADGAPDFDGTLKLTRPAKAADVAGLGSKVVPWRANGHVKASASSALFDKAEFQYGPDARALRLSGVVDFKFGKTPQYNAIVSGRQLDLDTLVDVPEATRATPAAAVQQLAELFGGALKPPIPGRVGLSVDNVTLAGNALREVRGDLTSDGDGWNIEALEFRAPGFTSARLSGHVTFSAQNPSFEGPASIEVSDPKALLTWIAGRPAAGLGLPGALRATGQLTLGPDRIAVDQLRAEVDRKTLTGRLLYAPAQYRQRSRLELEIRAAEIDVDDLIRFSPALFAGSKPELPGSVQLSLNVDRVLFAGLAATQAALQLTYRDSGLDLTRFSIGDVGGAALTLSGRIRSLFHSPEGGATLTLSAGNLDGVTKLAAKLDPAIGEAIEARIGRASSLNVRATLAMNSVGKPAGQSAATIEVDGAAGARRLHFEARATGDPGDFETLEIVGKGNLATDEGAELVRFLGLTRWLNVEKGPGAARLALSGRVSGKMETDAQLELPGFALNARGPAYLRDGAGPRAEFDASLVASNASRLLGDAASGEKLPMKLNSHVSVSAGKIALKEIAGSINDSPVSGELGIEFAATPHIEGALKTESVPVPRLLANVLGISSAAFLRNGFGSPEPFGPGWFDRMRGRIQLDARGAVFAQGLEGDSLHARVRFGAAELAFEDVDAAVGRGRFRGELAFRRDAAGVSTHARLAVTDFEASRVGGSEGHPADGRVSVQVEVEAAGSSPAALIGSLNGGGTISIESARLPSLDPRAFSVAIEAADEGLPITAKKLNEVVGAALAKGDLMVPRADGAVTIVAGRATVSNLIAHGEGADLNLSGTLDLAKQTIDARLTLSGPGEGGAPGSARPDLFLRLQGRAAAPERTVDVSALVNWLMLRSLDRETRRMEAIEREKQSSAAASEPAAITSKTEPANGAAAARPPKADVPPSAAPKRSEAHSLAGDHAPTLPPPMEIRPAPGVGPRSSGRSSAPPRPVRPPERQNPSFLDRLLGTHN